MTITRTTQRLSPRTPHTWKRLRLPSTLIRHENGAIRKRSTNRRNLKRQDLRFSVELSGEFSARLLKLKSKMTGNCDVFKLFSSAQRGRKTFEVFSEWNRDLRFEILSVAWWRQGLTQLHKPRSHNTKLARTHSFDDYSYQQSSIYRVCFHNLKQVLYRL